MFTETRTRHEDVVGIACTGKLTEDDLKRIDALFPERLELQMSTALPHVFSVCARDEVSPAGCSLADLVLASDGSGHLARCQGLHVAGLQGLAADGPVSALELLDTHPGDSAQAFPFDRDHRLGDLVDELLLLLRGEDILDQIDGDERHVVSPSGSAGGGRRAQPCPTRAFSCCSALEAARPPLLQDVHGPARPCL